MTTPQPNVAKLSELVGAGLDHTTIHVGLGATTIPAARLAEAGAARVGPSARQDLVAAILTNDVGSLEVILGSITAGARLISLPLPGRGSSLESYVGLISSLRRQHGFNTVVADRSVCQLLESVGIPNQPNTEPRPWCVAGDNGFELVQYTSGTTGRPKGIGLADRALGINVAAIIDAVEPQEGDVTVSWLPLSHDMGLIGMLLTSICAATPDRCGDVELVLLDPATFLRRPMTWLEAIATHNGTFTAAPDFAYRRAAARHTNASALRLGSLRCAIVGGEIIRESTLLEFTVATTPAMLNPTAMRPAYGMAEIGLAATITRQGDDWRDRIHSAPTDVEPTQPIGRIVASGEPLAGYNIVAPEERAAGRIVLRAPSLGNDASTGRPLGSGNAYITNDVGFVRDGHLYVTGRSDDIIVTRGRNHHAPTIEAAVGAVEGVRPGRVATTVLTDGAWTVFAETAADDDDHTLRDRIAAQIVALTGATPDHVALLRPGSLPFTTSGKLQRHQLTTMLLDRNG